MIIIFQNEILKIKRTMIGKLTFILPILLTFLMLYILFRFEEMEEMAVFYEVFATWSHILGIVTPIFVGLIAGMMGEQEFEAGNFYNLKKSKDSVRHFIVKNTVILELIILFISLSTLGLVFLLQIFYENISIDIFHIIRFMLMFFLSILYFSVCSLWVSFFLGIGASIGFGLFGTLIVSYLSVIPVINENILNYFPLAWIPKVINEYSYMGMGEKTLLNSIGSMFFQGIFFLIILVFSTKWFKEWNGRSL